MATRSSVPLLSLPPSSRDPRDDLHRHSAPSLFRGGWRRRVSSASVAFSLAGDALVKGATGLTLLHEPSEPRVDFIFVHGLHGGSRKTWSIRPEDPSTYWPEQWLPYESGFKHVRIHAFGYDSDWSSTQHSALRIRDFAQSLVNAISDSQTLKKPSKTPLVFVAHSMGGLVVKQAYLLARHQNAFNDVAARIHTMYFLATPHRGSNSAAYLKAYLALSFPTGAKAYVKELLPDSDTVMDINEDFRHVCKDLHIWSYFEALPTAGVMIVEKASAVIGLPDERVEHLPADHRHVCKFHSMQDPSYTILRDGFRTTVESIDKDCVGRRSAQMKLIAKALDMTHHPENELSRVQDQCHPGTCGWLTEDPGFQRWLGFDVGNDFGIGISTQSPPRFLWLNGPPGSGKSIVSGQVIKYLSSYNLDCCYFFFKNDTKATVTDLLLNLAFQMAEVNIEAREALLAMINNGDDVNTQDHTVIWNSLFIGRLFKIQFSQPLFWVIDALDECPKMSLMSLIQKMAKMDAAIPIRVFLTSRPDSPDAPVEQLLDEEGIKRVELQTGHGRSMHDIAAFIRSRPRLSRLLDEDKSNKLMSTILEKSRGIFLWAALTVARLDQLYTLEDIEAALNQVPSGMNDFYAKILETVKNSSTADKAHCILKWVVCAAMPMTVDELKEAVRLDIGQTILGSTSGDVFSEMCGSLAATGNDGRVHWMHQTVKEFLTSPESGLYVNYREAHGQISAICLQHLLGKTFTRHSSRRSKPASPSAFAEYASANFSHHLRRSRSIFPSLFSSVVKFTNTKSLVWIEHVARRGKLASFISTIQNIKPYLARQLERSPPFAADYQAVSTWVNDLTRIVAIFGPTIIECPGSIYAFIPPLCPTSSMFHRIYAKASPQKIICASNETWEERLSSISCPAAAKAVATKDHFLAIGLMNGNIRIFNSSTLEELKVLSHRAPLRHLAFGNISNILASCSSGKLDLWEPNHEQRWSAQIDGVASSVAFNADDSKIFITLSKNFKQEVLVFHTEDGTPLDPLKIRLGEHDDSSDSSSNEGTQRSKQVKRYCAEVVRFAPVLGYAAVTFRASHLTILSLDDEDNLEKFCCIRKGGTEDLRFAPDIHDVAFNPAVESELVAVAYQDGDIVVFRMDEWNPEQLYVHSMHAYALASSPDGRTLAAGDTLGGVSLFAFDTLRLLHRTETLDDAVTRLAFAPNSLRLYDVRGRSCNIWEPPVLVRKNYLDDNSTDPEEPEPVDSPEPKELALSTFGDSKTITAITSAGDDDKLIFCGRDNGSVSVHELKSGRKILDLKLHSASIQQVEWNASARLLVTTDVSTRCIATQLPSIPSTSYPGDLAETLFNVKTSALVLQVVIRPDGQAVLLSTSAGEELWEGNRFTQSKHSLGDARWIQHPSDQTTLFLARGNKLRLFHWAHLTEPKPTLKTEITISLGNAFTNLTLADGWVSRADTSLIVQLAQLPPTQSSQNVFVMLDADKIPTQPASATAVQPSCAVRSFSGGIKAILGLTRSSVYFLTRSGWVCSMSLRSLPEPTSYTRHLFIPPFWRTEGEFLVKIVAKNSLVIANGDDLIVVHGFGDFEHKISW